MRTTLAATAVRAWANITSFNSNVGILVLPFRRVRPVRDGPLSAVGCFGAVVQPQAKSAARIRQGLLSKVGRGACTATPACPLHETSLDAAIGRDKAIALLIATPAFCQTAICGPVLDLLVARQAQFADVVTMIHAEVYPNDEAVGRTTTDVVKTYGLPWEPSLFLALPDGTITHRLDYTYDQRELDEALSTLVQ